MLISINVIKRQKMKRSNKSAGFSVIEILIVVVIIGLVGFVGWTVFIKNKKSDKPVNNQTSTPSVSQPAATATEITWMQTEDGYRPSSTPPACDAKLVKQFPADITKVTSVLYPGQVRGNDYKPHGGLRFDKSDNNSITVKAPFDGKVIDGSAYIAQDPENDVQYSFDVMNDCGMMYRVGHLLTLSPQLAEIAKTFPKPAKGDSRTTNVNPPVKIIAGTVLATGVGTASDHNTFFDWGVYDWNKPNSVSSNQSWLTDPRHNNSLAKHAVCWFGMLSANDENTIRSLPAGDPTGGKTSDYCK